MNLIIDNYRSMNLGSKEPAQKYSMKTRGNSNIPISECTEFTMHISQKTEFANSRQKLVDYTEHKLRKYIEKIRDKQQELILNVMLVDYVKGNIAVAWRKGQPVYVNVTKG